MLKMPFDSPEALQLSERISESIYYAALLASMELAKRYGPYPKFEGSDFSKGILQFDHYQTTPKYHDFGWLKE
jgi:ribonucleotide reductase alpha subunit